MIAAEANPERAASIGYAVEYTSGEREIYGRGPQWFTLHLKDKSHLHRLLTGSTYSAALEYIHGRIDISGDLVAALRFRQARARPGFRDWLWSIAARFSPVRLETWFQGCRRAARNIRFHYDVSNGFYEAFLDSRMVYSAARFESESESLDQAQETKLRQICEDLNLHPGERFLDIGCGWGALLAYAAGHYRVNATGCTLSHSQYEFTDALIHSHRLEGFASVEEEDYRDVNRRFDKISSVGMYEHVGRHRISHYFRKVHDLLERGGLFLNSGIVRPEAVRSDPQTWFLLRRVFPGGELPHLSQVMRAAENAGFAIIRLESLRHAYARTCEQWVARLRRNRDTCIGLVGRETYRTWLLYLAASAVSFDAGSTDVFSILMSRL